MKLNAEMIMKSFSVNREKKGKEEGPIYVSIGFGGVVAIDSLTELFSTVGNYANILQKLYATGGELINTDLTSMKLSVENENVDCIIETGVRGKIELEGGSIDEISIVPKPGSVCEISCRVQAKPSNSEVGKLAQLLHEQVTVSILPRQAELGLGQGEEAAA